MLKIRDVLRAECKQLRLTFMSGRIYMGGTGTTIRLTQKILFADSVWKKNPSEFIVKEEDTNTSFPTIPSIYALILKKMLTCSWYKSKKEVRQKRDTLKSVWKLIPQQVKAIKSLIHIWQCETKYLMTDT